MSRMPREGGGDVGAKPNTDLSEFAEFAEALIVSVRRASGSLGMHSAAWATSTPSASATR